MEIAEVTKSCSAPGWIEFGVDSACCSTCVPVSETTMQKISTVKDKKTGCIYRTANNAQVPDQGRKSFEGTLGDGGAPIRVHARAVDIKRPLMSVYGMVQAGYKVVFDCFGSYAEERETGRRIPLTERKRGWTLQMKVNPCSPSVPQNTAIDVVDGGGNNCTTGKTCNCSGRFGPTNAGDRTSPINNRTS